MLLRRKFLKVAPTSARRTPIRAGRRGFGKLQTLRADERANDADAADRARRRRRSWAPGPPRPETPERRRDTREAQRHQRHAETPERRRDTRDTQRHQKGAERRQRPTKLEAFRLPRDFGLSARARGGVGVARVRPSSARAREARRLARIGALGAPRARTLAPGPPCARMGTHAIHPYGSHGEYPLRSASQAS